jgi:hypothetical protein
MNSLAQYEDKLKHFFIDRNLLNCVIQPTSSYNYFVILFYLLIYLIGLAIFLESKAKVSQNKQFRNTKKEFLKFYENIFYLRLHNTQSFKGIHICDIKTNIEKQFIIYLNIYFIQNCIKF